MNNLNLSLYAFHLCQSLDDAPDTQSKDAGLVWDSLRGLAAKIPFPELAQFPEPTDANPAATLNFQAIEIDDRSLTGNLSTFKIHDTYSLDLTLTFTDQQTHFSPEKAAIFQPQALIEVTANLGKFLWLVGESEELSERQLPTVQQWAKQLCQDAQWIAEDQLFNSPLFIFTADAVTILISVAQPGIVDLDRAKKNYYDLRNLFWTYQKTLVVGKRAKASYQEARQLYSDLEAKVQEFNQVFSQTPEERLQKLDALLQTIPQKLLDYNCKLRDLKAHYTTIDVNLKNFKLCLSHILNEQAGDRLSHWSNFATQTAPLTLNQIKTYIDYLEPGQILFSDLINSIRATTELDQAKSDRAWQQWEKEQDKQLQAQLNEHQETFVRELHEQDRQFHQALQTSRDDAQQQSDDLQHHIEAVGVGIAAGATLVSTSELISEPWAIPSRDHPLLPPHPFIFALLLSFFGSCVAWWIATKLIQRYRRSTGSSPNPEAEQSDRPPPISQ